MRKIILFAIIALLTVPGNLTMAANTAARMIRENRDKEFAFYVNITNRHTSWHTYNKAARKAKKEMLKAYGDSISEDSINKILPKPDGYITKRRISKQKGMMLVAYDSEIHDFAAELDKAHDAYCQFELNSMADTIMLDGRNKEMAKLISNMLPPNGGVSFYYTHGSFMLTHGIAIIIYSENRKLQSILYLRNRPFRIFF